MTARSLAKIYRGTPRNLALLANALLRGEPVGVPTETVYGLAANALDVRACRKIFQAKGRPSSDPLIVHLFSARQLEAVAFANESALKLARLFWPGPLTIVLPKRATIPDIVSAGLPSVALRVPRHPLFRRLLALTELPLAAPSANPFGYVSPTTAEHVRLGLGRKIRWILDGGPAEVGLESTIVDLREPAAPQLLRPGAITHAQLEKALGQTVQRRSKSSRLQTQQAQIAPGLLTRHYSPRTPSTLHEQLDPIRVGQAEANVAWIFIRRPKGALSGQRNVFWLDEHGQLRRAAKHLFERLRTVDAMGFQHLHLERAHGDEMAEAINDRLQRAAASLP